MVEVVVSSLLVGTVVVGALSMLGSSVHTQTVATELVDGPALADSLLAEIMSMPYEDPEDGGLANGINTGESNVSRLSFDDVDDYDGWSPTDVQDRLGNVMSEYTGWTRSATVVWADRLTGNTWLPNDTGLKRIEVTVVAPDGTVTKRFGFRARDGSLEQAPAIDKTVVTQIISNLSVGSANGVQTVVNLLNHVEAPNGI